MEKVLLKSHYKGMSPKELSYYLHPESLKKEEVTDTILSMSAGFTSEMYINQMKATLDRIDFSATIDTFNYSVMIIGAQNDKVVPVSMLTDLHHRIKRSQLHVIDQSGHYLPLERPDDLSDLIKNFL
jgi:pimeloyl-ACP methyl ester carboxylesterase